MAKEGVSVRRKVGCSIAIAVSALLIVFSFCGWFFKSSLKDVANFFVGSFGMSFYGMMIAVIVACSFMLAGKSIRVPAKYTVHFILLFLEIVLLVHMFSTIYICYNAETKMMIPYADYANTVYHYYTGVPTFGGIVFGTIVYGLQRVITIYATAILLFGLLAWSVIMVGDFFFSYFTGRLTLIKPHEETEPQPDVTSDEDEPVGTVEDERQKAMRILFPGATPQPDVVDTEIYPTAPQSTLDSQNTTEYHTNTEKKRNSFFDDAPQSEVASDDIPDEELGVKGYYKPSEPMPQPEQVSSDNDSWKISSSEDDTQAVSDTTKSVADNNGKTVYTEDGWIKTEESKPIQTENEIDVVDVVTEEAVDTQKTTESDTLTFDFEEENNDELDMPSQLVNEEETTQEVEPTQSYAEPQTVSDEALDDDDGELVPIESETPVPGGIQVGIDFHSKSEIKEAQEKVHKYPKYAAPPIDLLNDAMIVEDDDEDFRMRSTFAIINKLAMFKIKVESAGQVVGPSVTRYMFRVLSLKTKMSEFNQYAQDLKACLEAEGEIRIEAPIPGSSLVGIEVANKVRTPVALRTVLESKTYRETKGNLLFVVGQQISGEMVVDDLSKLPHLLVAGTTGSGKSVFLHSLIVSLMYRYGPEYLRFVMVDPKLVEFGRYNGIPHMLTRETITNAPDALAAMDYLIAEMESRYQLLKQYNVANIMDYNAKINPRMTQRLPYLVLIVDELADLMSTSKKSFEDKLQKLAQKARAAGIHLVLATQRPDTQVISGTIKTNFPCRVALKVASYQDSSTILNGGGAEKLLGYGDMLYMQPRSSDLQRIQGTYLTDEEITSFVEYVKSQNEGYFDPKASEMIFVSEQEQKADDESAKGDAKDAKPDLDPYCKKALRFCLERNGGRASIASIQRSLHVGFNRAGRIMDTLQKLHYVEELAPNETNSKPLRVLVSLDQLDDLFPDMDDSY